MFRRKYSLGLLDILSSFQKMMVLDLPSSILFVDTAEVSVLKIKK